MKFLFILFILASCASLKFPQEQDPHLKLCFVGDVGKASAVQFTVKEALKLERCHEIYVLGDVIYPDGIQTPNDIKFFTHFWNYYEDLTKRDFAPRFHMVMGNHDYNGKPEVWLELAKLYPKIIFPDLSYCERYKDICLTILDSNKDLEKQASNIKKQKKCKHKLVLAHHPYKSNGPNHTKVDQHHKDFYEKNVLGKSEALITGHEHVLEYIGKEKETMLIISGAGGALAEGRLPGYLVVEKTGPKSQELVYKLRTIHGKHVRTEIIQD